MRKSVIFDDFHVPVACDYRLIVGGPDGEVKMLRVFKKGEVLRGRKTSRPGTYPDMYEIANLPGTELSRGVISSFLLGFEHASTAPTA